MQTWRHGDVMVATVPAIPDGARRRPTAVLARGEATGHSHRIRDAATAEVFDHQGVGYLRVVGASALLVHDEHKGVTGCALDSKIVTPLGR